MKLLITAGPTREPIDVVRFISNRSSGRMGLAVAAAAVVAGHDVTLLLGPGIDAPSDATVLRFVTTDDLQRLLTEQFPAHDVLVMAAAVADYRPVNRHDAKLPRGESLTLELAPTPDLVAAIAADRRADQRVVGFALEPAESLEQRAQAKLKRKNLDAIVANPLETMDAADVDATWFDAGGAVRPGAMSKADFGRWLVDKIVSGFDLR